MTRPNASLYYRTTNAQPVGVDTPLGRLLRTPGVVTVEHLYHIDERGRANGVLDCTLWTRNAQSGLQPFAVIEQGGTAQGVAAMRPEVAHGVLQVLATNLCGTIESANLRMAAADSGYTGCIRALFTSDGWILIDSEAGTNAVNFPEWEDCVTSQHTSDEERQEATDNVDWPRFGMLVLPKPASAHEALALQAVAERMAETAMEIHAAQGLALLNQNDWTVAPET